MTPEDLEKLTPTMIKQARLVSTKFRSYQPIKEIEYVMNDDLYKKYSDARKELKKSLRSTKEVLVFHGTAGGNIPLYFLYLLPSND
jgi:hypothetical protein